MDGRSACFRAAPSDTGNGALGIGDALTKHGLRDRLSEPFANV